MFDLKRTVGSLKKAIHTRLKQPSLEGEFGSLQKSPPQAEDPKPVPRNHHHWVNLEVNSESAEKCLLPLDLIKVAN